MRGCRVVRGCFQLRPEQPLDTSEPILPPPRNALARLALPEPWNGNVQASLRLIDQLQREIASCEAELRTLGADHRYVPLLLIVPGIGWELAYTIAAEIGDIARFASPRKLSGYTGLCPRVYQSGDSDRRGPLAKQGPKYLRWAFVGAAVHASTHPAYRDRYQHTKTRLGKQRGAKIAQVDLARRLAEAIWHMLTRNQLFAPAGACVNRSPPPHSGDSQARPLDPVCSNVCSQRMTETTGWARSTSSNDRPRPRRPTGRC